MTIVVNLSAGEFKRFSRFDTFRRRKMWRSPAIFASILSVSALICFLMHHVEGAIMLGCVLLIVGLGMPLVYFVTFFSSLRKQVRTLGLSRPQWVYTLCLTEKAKGISVDNGREHADYAWKDVYHVYFGDTATYLYMTPARAFILPHSCVEEGFEVLWQFLKKKLPAEKCTVLK